ncbi:MAG: hypothetical protein ACI83P_000531 [Janthinobacterium sp.]|jgi:hypothetical protein
MIGVAQINRPPTDIYIRNTKPRDQSCKLSDGTHLYLYSMPADVQSMAHEDPASYPRIISCSIHHSGIA